MLLWQNFEVTTWTMFKLTRILTLKRMRLSIVTAFLCEIQGIFHKGLHLFQQNESSWQHGK